MQVSAAAAATPLLAGSAQAGAGKGMRLGLIGHMGRDP